MESDKQVHFLSTLLQLEKRLRDASNVGELNYRLANETLNLVLYDHLLVWHRSISGALTIDVISGVDRLTSSTPFVVDARQLVVDLVKKKLVSCQVVSLDTLPQELLQICTTHGWQQLLWVPLLKSSGGVDAGVLVLRETQSWSEQEVALFSRLADTATHARLALNPRSRKIPTKKWLHKRIFIGLLLAAVVGAMLWPVRLSVLAPAEVVSRQSVMITAPMDGIVKSFHVRPNEEVEQGQLVVTLDQTSLSNQYLVAQKSYQVVKTEYETAQQRAFVDAKVREQIHLFKTQMAQKEAEAEYVNTMLQQTEIHTPQAGVAVFTDENEWLGHPVFTGQKLLEIASATQVQLEIMLLVADAITLDKSVELAFYLNIAPTKPLYGHITHVGYEASVVPAVGLAYPVKAQFSSVDDTPRIGLRGTAKIYGKKVPLIYAVLRKPLTQLRQLLGV